MPFPTSCWPFILLSFHFLEIIPYKGKNCFLKSLPVKCFNRCCQDLFYSVFPPVLWDLPPLSLTGKHNLHACTLASRIRTTIYWQGGQEASCLVWDSLPCTASIPHAQDGRTLNRAHLNLFKWVCLWSIACGELCYSSPWTRWWWALRFSSEGRHGMCLRACSQSLAVSLWSLLLLLCLFLYMVLKFTWGFWKANTEQYGTDQVWVQGCHKASAEWLLPVVCVDCYNRLRQSLLITSTVSWDINTAAGCCTAGREDTSDQPLWYKLSYMCGCGLFLKEYFSGLFQN